MRKMHSENWDDLRYVLAVAEIGTVSGAARALSVNHATVLRRIAAFEDRYGHPLFERNARGYVIPPDRLRILQAVRDVGAAVDTVGQLMTQGMASPTGLVRITSTDSLCLAVLPEILGQLQADQKGLKIELITSNAHVDFSRLHAHITVRPAEVLPDDLNGEIAAHMGFDVFGPQGAKGWLMPAGPLRRSVAGRWMDREVPSSEILGSADSFPALAALSVASGARAILPVVIGAREPGLRRLHMPEADISVPIWVACHNELSEMARYKAVQQALRDAIARKADHLAGR